MTLINKLKTKYRITVGYIRGRINSTGIMKIVLETENSNVLETENNNVLETENKSEGKEL
jgi:hypothetical protein